MQSWKALRKGVSKEGASKNPGEGKPEKGPSPLGWDH